MSLPTQIELLQAFSGFLFEAGLSSVSVKNYLSDVRHFLAFCTTLSDSPLSIDEIFQSITKYVDLYVEDQKSHFVPANSTNRRLASIRRFSTFLHSKYQVTSISTNPGTVTNATSTPSFDNSSLKLLNSFRSYLQKENKSHSTVKNYVSDVNHFINWSANITPFTTQSLDKIVSENQVNAYVSYLRLNQTVSSVIARRQSSIKQFAKFCFENGFLSSNVFEKKIESIKISPLNWIERFSKKSSSKKIDNNSSKIVDIYNKYNQLPFTPYLHLAILVLATTAMGIFAYNQIISNAFPSQAYPTALTSPTRQLSFQGRLTDSSSNPITTATNVTFTLFNALSGGTTLYQSGTCTVTPDQNGIFNTLIGDGSCGAGIGSSVFTENTSVFIEVGVAAQTLSPRQQIATVGYALNSETLQGYPASPSATENTIPVMNNSGDIVLGSLSPVIQSTSGTFTLEGRSLSLTTATGSNGNIVIQPDSSSTTNNVQILTSGTTNDQLRISNSALTSGTLISGYIGNNSTTGDLLSLSSGSVETDRFNISGFGQTTITASARNKAALIVNQVDGGSIFTASASGVSKFIIDNGGKVGVGTASPLFALDVATTSGGIAARFGGRVVGSNAVNNDEFITLAQLTAGTGQYWSRTGTNVYLTTNTDNVGIGTTTPSSTLDIVGNAEINGYATISASLAVGYTNVTGGIGNAVFSNNVGIGTNNPSYKLHVVGTNGASFGGNAAEVAYIIGGNGGSHSVDFETAGSGGSMRFIGGNGGANSAAEGLGGPGGDIYLSGGSGGSSGFLVGTSGRYGNILMQTSGGNVGIGSINPQSLLDVNGNAFINGSATVSGRVAIGMTTPLFALDVATTSGGIAARFGGRVVGSNAVNNNEFVTLSQLTSGTGQYWSRNGTNVYPTTITDNIGIGLTNPVALLQVGGTASISGALTLYGTPTITTTSNQTLTLSANTSITGNIAVSGTAWTATPTISGLITATSGLTANGALTANNTFTLGDNGDTGSINTSDWGINVTGDMTGIGSIAMNGAITGATGFNGLVVTANTGVITTGTWNGSLIGLAYGGTNKNMTAVNGGIVWTDADSMEVTAAGVAGQVLLSNGAAAPTWSALSAVNYWQRNLGVLSPLEITNDFAIGGTATSSAKFQISGLTGDASTSGHLAFKGTSPSYIHLLNGNDLRFSSSVGGDAGNTERMILTNTGNLGIGTTTPGSSLDVQNSTTGIIRVGTSNTNMAATDIAGKLEFYKADPSTGGAGSPVYIQSRAFDLGGLFAMDFVTGSISAPVTGLSINQVGNVGVGITTPLLKLDIVGVAGLPATSGTAQNGSLRLENGGAAVLDMGSQSSGLGAWLQSTNNTNLAINYPLLFNPNGGNVGVGTTVSPVALFQVAGTASISGALTMYGTPTITTTSNQLLTLSANTKITGSFVDSTGAVGSSGQFLSSTVTGTAWSSAFSSSTASISGDLTVGGKIKPATGPLTLQYKDTANTWADGLVIRDVTGNVGIGVTSGAAVNAKLMVAGNIYPSANNTYDLGTTSFNWRNLSIASSLSSSGNTILDLTNVVANGSVSASLFWNFNNSASIAGDLGVGGTVTVGQGAGKIDVGQVDPPYTINGEKFATYMVAMTGSKEETTGKVIANELVEGLGYKTTIDLNNQTKGSDIWLFAKVTDLNNHLSDMSVLLSPEGQAKTWYEIDETSKTLTIFASTPAKISYRLTAPRFDSEKWQNKRDASGVLGLVINTPEVVTSQGTINNIAYNSEISKVADQIYVVKINNVQNNEIATFAKATIANLKAGLIAAQEIVTENLVVKQKLISPLAEIDTLKSTNIFTENASISGTLYAENIEGKSIDNINNKFDTLSSSYSTASAILAELQSKYMSYDSMLASVSGQSLIALENLNTVSTLPENVNFTSVATHTLLTDDAQINGTLIASSINSVTGDLFIQPDTTHAIHLLGNLMALLPSGEVVINGDLIVTGSVLANSVETKEATIGSSTFDASGSATFKQVVTDGLIIASSQSSNSSTESAIVKTNSTIGTSAIATGSSEIFISTKAINANTLVYLTPVSNTQNQVLYVKSKDEGNGFTVAVTSPASAEITFNYWLVKTQADK